MQRHQLADQLCQIARKGDAILLRQLMAKGATIAINVLSKRGERPLGAAAESGHLEAVKILVQYGADINAPDSFHSTPLVTAVCFGHEEIVKFLLAKDGIDVNVCDNGKMTALHWALKLSASECLTLLFAADVGPSVVIANRKGVYPLHTAVSEGLHSQIAPLIAIGADIESRDREGKTPLHYAYKSIDCTRELISKGAQANATDDYGDTALHIAANHNDEGVMRILLTAGNSDPNIANNAGNFPLDLAIYHNCSRIIELLESHKARRGKPYDPTQARKKKVRRKVDSKTDESVAAVQIDVGLWRWYFVYGVVAAWLVRLMLRNL